jgi:hypothetical protein
MGAIIQRKCGSSAVLRTLRGPFDVAQLVAVGAKHDALVCFRHCSFKRARGERAHLSSLCRTVDVMEVECSRVASVSAVRAASLQLHGVDDCPPRAVVMLVTQAVCCWPLLAAFD